MQVAAAQSLVHLDNSSTKRAGDIISAQGIAGIKLKRLVAVHNWMESANCDKIACEAFRKKALEAYPVSTYFKQ